ncbi:Myb-like, SWIRM and MPN domains 1 [Desmophyllum pertusum]|uniref:Myb-like, SWIRM and MPN domains 1 n=1 Tax=Desmophyllum pertusum TaxID=174260 RepID=A0A9X0D3C6_9CNID|nr:Myb-like, SWIRM and MPN domains 1 [Desmophyllum pertusum]
MAESEEEVDVEDISDGEQISNLRDLAEDDHKDKWYDNVSGFISNLKLCLGDIRYEKDIGNQSFLNPSNSPFSSEYCDPNSWLLDTNSVWSLDPCTDDKSRSAIEKMILEEQSVSMKLEQSPTADKRKQTTVGRTSNANVKKSIIKSRKEQPSLTHRKPWTIDEQELFEQGLGLYGRSWTKIANIIDTRTTLQVKNYAKQYFRQKNKALVESEATQGSIEDQSKADTFVVASDVEQVVNENSVSEDEQAVQSTFVSSPVAKDKPQCESDEDIEIDVDGSDSEELNTHLIPGQTTSCPEAVYSALVQAAAVENLQDSVNQESDVASLEGNPALAALEDMSPSPSQPEICASVIVDARCSLNDEEIPPRVDETPPPSSTLYAGRLTRDCEEDIFPERPLRLPNNISSNVNVVLEHTRSLNEETGENSSELVSSKKSVDDQACEQALLEAGCGEESDRAIGINAPLETIDSSPQQPQLSDSKDWVPVTYGEVTSCELLDSSDREQPGASVTFEKPIVIDRNVIQDLEKQHNAEFFMGRALKTPERYMKIRNYILDMWEKTNPNFLFKTAVRGGLRNCGDVNSIGRVHAFLEDIGAINEGCFDRPVLRVRQQGEVTDVKENVHMESWVNSLRPRKKRQRNVDGDWVDFSKPEGMTIQHLSSDQHDQQEGVPNERGSPSVPRKRPSRSKPSYDPFLLVPCRKFPSPSAVPFDVRIQSETLVVMDTHAHMSTTEVIGLLGGNYSHGSRTLKEWFGKGGAPFIGIIVSPYNYSNPSNQSQIRCLTVSDEWESAGQYRLPYQFDYEVFRDESDEDDTVEQVKSIADDYRRYPFRVQLNRRFGASSNLDLLDKLVDSLRARISSTSDDKTEAFLSRLKNTISENIKPRTPIPADQQSEVTLQE